MALSLKYVTQKFRSCDLGLMVYAHAISPSSQEMGILFYSVNTFFEAACLSESKQVNPSGLPEGR